MQTSFPTTEHLPDSDGDWLAIADCHWSALATTAEDFARQAIWHALLQDVGALPCPATSYRASGL
jgi:hypothetical protein